MIRFYKAFLTKNGITNYTPSLELQMKMNNSLKQLANLPSLSRSENASSVLFTKDYLIHVIIIYIQTNKGRKKAFTIGL